MSHELHCPECGHYRTFVHHFVILWRCTTCGVTRAIHPKQLIAEEKGQRNASFSPPPPHLLPTRTRSDNSTCL